MNNEINELLRMAGFLKFERNDALLDKGLNNPLSPKNILIGHWFYETVYKIRKEEFDRFIINAKARNLTYHQFISEWVKIVRYYYEYNGWKNFWDMFRDKEAEAKKAGWYITPKPPVSHKKLEQTPDGEMYRLDKEKIRSRKSAGFHYGSPILRQV